MYTGSWCVLVEYVKDNYYARFHDPRYHRYREINCYQTLTDGRTEIRTPISHPAISRCDKIETRHEKKL